MKRLILSVLSILLLLSVSILVSCKSENEKSFNKTNEVGEAAKKKLVRLVSEFPEPIKLDSLKSLEFLSTTSGVMPHSEIKQLCIQDKKGFYGFYLLLNEKKRI